MTVDDLFLWKGLVAPETHSPDWVARQFTAAFRNAGHPPVYAFSSTAPLDDDPTLREVLDHWVESGNHVGNHTHYHSSLNWVSSDVYIADTERSEKVIAPYLDQAPSRYFRYSFDMWGDTPEKTAAVQNHLVRSGYLPCPLTYWFYDAQFISPHLRALVSGDDQARKWVEDTAVATAVDQFRRQVTASREALGRDIVHIGLMHGSPIMGACADRIFQELAALGVEWVTLEEAMSDPANVIPPGVTTRQFRNFTQKRAAACGVSIEGVPPVENIRKGHDIVPVDGMTEHELFGAAIMQMAAHLEGCRPNGDDLDWDSSDAG